MAKKIRNFLLSISLFVAILLVWKVFCMLGIISPWLLSGPEATFYVFFKLILDGTLLKLVGISFLNVFPAFFMAVILALVLGVAIGMSKTVSKIFSPFISSIYIIPSLAWLPLIIIFFGFNRSAIWAIIFISSFVRMIYSVIGGVVGINLNWLLTARNLEVGGFSMVFKVIVPGALPQIMSGVRTGFGSAWRSLIGAEMLVVTAGGLGKYIWLSQWDYNLEQVLSGIIIIALIGIVTEKLVFKKIEEKTLCKWGMVQ